MKFYCLSLGCAKNGVDSERLIGALVDAGHELVDSPSEAEACIVNTCGFIRQAVEESVDAILDLEALRQKGELKVIGVVGCLLNRYGDELVQEFPDVDFWAHCEDWGTVVEGMAAVPQNVLSKKNEKKAAGNKKRKANFFRRICLPAQAPFVRYLKITEGCDNHCSYCAIPSIRGPLRSVSIKELVLEAQGLVAQGAKELCLVGQDLTLYGRDAGGQGDLIGLLDALEESLPDDVWLRLLYIHPNRLDDALAERVLRGRQILPYLDVPIQHAHPEILAAMNRPTPKSERLADLFLSIRQANPDFALRTTCMVGFPGETQAHFDYLLDFLERVEFDRLGAFAFSPEEGTPAAKMAHQVRDTTKSRRLDTLMALQQTLSFARQERFVGRTLEVMAEAKIDVDVHGDDVRSSATEIFEGRSYREAPEVDGVVEFGVPKGSVKPGDRVRIRITEALEHDLFGELERPEAP